MDFLILIGGALVVLVIGLGAGYLLQRKMTAERSRLAEQKAREAVEEAKREAGAVRKEAEIQAKDHFFRARTEFEQEGKERRQELLNMEKRLHQKEENLEKRVDLLEQKAFRAAVDRVAPSVVRIESGPSVGSGFFVTDDLIATNVHVLAGATQARVSSGQGAEVAAIVVYVDPDLDF
ncbi:MAG: Rnase Y domain-containing protein, partial [Deltaproteobacteria bacterium]|nr:Rnase Y domain-containing protein [Deltaproteobacteria bacterium]